MVLLENEEREERALVVCEQSDGILPFYKVFYYHSVLYSAGRSLESFDRYEKIKNTEVSPDYLAERYDDTSPEQHHHCWFLLRLTASPPLIIYYAAQYLACGYLR